MLAFPGSTPTESWFPDTRATHHLAHNTTNLTRVHPYQGNDQVTIGNGKRLCILHVGSKLLSTPSKNFQLNRVYHVPTLATSLISISRFCHDNNAFFKFHSYNFLSRINSWKKLYSKANLRMSSIIFMWIPCKQSPPPCSQPHLNLLYLLNRMSNLLSSTHGWTILLPIFSSMLSFLVISLFTLIILSLYYLLIWKKKNHKLPFSLFESKASNILDLIHTNLWGLITPIPSTTSAQYFLLLLDDCFPIFMVVSFTN